MCKCKYRHNCKQRECILDEACRSLFVDRGEYLRVQEQEQEQGT